MIELDYETFSPERHDLLKVAELVYAVDYRTFDLLFKDKQSAVNAIAKDLPKRGYGGFFKVILDDAGNVIGALLIYTSKTPHRFYLKSLKLFMVDVLDHFVLSDIGDDDFYIAEIAIDSSLRSQGIGRTVILDVTDYAKSKNYKRVILDVDFRNVGAKSLYERLGFKEFNKKRVKIGKFERGMHNMELEL